MGKKTKLEKLSIFKNAYYMYHAGVVRLDTQTDNKLYYLVQDAVSEKEHSVIISFNEQKKIVQIQCDCTSNSLKLKHLPFCSHMMVATIQAVFKLGKPKR